MSDDDLRQRAIKFLLNHRGRMKKENEFTTHELEQILNLDKTTVYRTMRKLVATGLWEEGEAIDPSTNRLSKVWWLKDSAQT